MSSDNQKILNLINKLFHEISEIKVGQSEIKVGQSEIKTQLSKLEESKNEDSVKLDIILNNGSQQNTSSSVEIAEKKSNKPTYFKYIFANKKDEYINILYTQDIIDSYEDHPDVKNKKNGYKTNKIANLIYNEYIKKNSTYSNEYERIYAEYASTK